MEKLSKAEVMALALNLVATGVLSIDDEGRIWRHQIRNHSIVRVIAPRRAENVGGKGYLRLTFQVSGYGLVQVMAHRLVYACKVGPVQEELQINHEDLNKQNNRPSNLTLMTGTENMRHSYANGHTVAWSKTSMSDWRDGKPRISKETRAAIRARRLGGAKLKEVSAEFGVSMTHVQRISRKEVEEC